MADGDAPVAEAEPTLEEQATWQAHGIWWAWMFHPTSRDHYRSDIDHVLVDGRRMVTDATWYAALADNGEPVEETA